MINNRRAFTFVELLIAIIILGILAVTAVPEFKKLFNITTQATVNSAAAALNAASSKNYMLAQSGALHVTVSNCTQISQTLPGTASLPSTMEIVSGALANGYSATCTVRVKSNTALYATFTGWGTS